MSPRACRGVPFGFAHCSLRFFDCAYAPLRMTGKRVVLTAFRMTGVMTHGGITKCPTIKLVIPNECEKSHRVSALVGGCFDYAQHDSRMSPRACRGVPQVKQCNGGIIRLHFVSLRMTVKRVVSICIVSVSFRTNVKNPIVSTVIPSLSRNPFG